MLKKLQYFPFTFRSLALGLLAYLALVSRALPEHDLILQALADICIIGICVAFFGGFAGYLICRNKFKKISVSFLNESNLEELNSNSEISLILTGNSLLVPSFLRIEISPNFEQSEIKTSSLMLSGRHRPLNLKLNFRVPYRGIWKLNDLNFIVQDSFGFCKFRHQQSLNREFEVYPKELSILDLPYLSESSISGEESINARDPIGDLFDLKTYDPSDGVKRILWKIYSKSGELVSRKPELSAVPDGEIAVFLIAAKTDDVLCGYFRNYLKQVRAQGLQVIFGTDGMNFDQLAMLDDLTILHAINLHVFDKTCGTGFGINDFVKFLANRHPNISGILIFTNEYPDFKTNLNLRFVVASPNYYEGALKIDAVG